MTTNSPGEVATWVRTVVPQFKRSVQALEIVVALVPCPYASGAEKRVVESIEGVDRVLSTWQTTLVGLGLTRLPDKFDLVLFLGGDPWHALLLARRLQCPTSGYFDTKNSWAELFDFPLFARESDLNRKGSLVGDLMVDSMSIQNQLGEASRQFQGPVLALFPGSRPWHVKAALGAFIHVFERIRPRVPEARCIVVCSPFVSDAQMQRALDHPWSLRLPTAKGKVLNGQISLEGGLVVEVMRGRPSQIFPYFDVALTIPGTNSAELAVAGKSFVLVVHELAIIGGGGLLNLVEKLPVPVSWKKYIRYRKLSRTDFLAIPNKFAQRKIVSEIVLTQDTLDLEDRLVELLQDPDARRAQGEALQAVMGQPGSALRMSERISEILESSSGLLRDPLGEWAFRYRGAIVGFMAVLNLSGSIPLPYSLKLGFAIAALGEGLRIWAIGYSGQCTRESFPTARQLVTSGPYQYCRNPLYLGNVLNFLGIFVACSGGWSWPIRLLMLLLNTLVFGGLYSSLIKLEERFLTGHFGDAYRDYQRSVPCFLPGAPSKPSQPQPFSWTCGVRWELSTLISWLLIWLFLALKLR